MKREEHRWGKQVVIRTMTTPDRVDAVTAIAEDEEGNAVLLQLYNQPEEVKADGKYSLVVDHIGDVVLLSLDAERMSKR
ncbi:tpr domain protein [Colletotrichum limetticola]|uniref:Tpr domain protein n=1 Tax=Colletotrichum limetticola TaxID=1209924 RepID=A0ABQ9P9N7_9PEZI|nr:tpr domain protein [Colletotrichum limetticola]